MLLSSSGEVQPNFGGALGRGEVAPCSQIRMGTFLEQRKREMELQVLRRLQSVWAFFFLLEDNLNIKMCAHHVQAKAIN